MQDPALLHYFHSRFDNTSNHNTALSINLRKSSVARLSPTKASIVQSTSISILTILIYMFTDFKAFN
jgi:hypothetical protein